MTRPLPPEERKERKRLRDAAYRSANKERLKQVKAVYIEANFDLVQARKRRWAWDNVDRVRASRKKSRTTHGRNPSIYNEKKKARDQERYRKKREHILALGAAWRKSNPERVRHLAAVRYQTKRERIDALGVKWRAANPDKCSAIRRNRRARLKNSSGTHTAYDIAWLRKVQQGRCAHPWCRIILGPSFHVDHVIALAIGGSNDRRNIQLLCRPCNQSKHVRHPIDVALQHGMLV